jgi:bacillopeptidase F (M6 metalloprotease family)
MAGVRSPKSNRDFLVVYLYIYGGYMTSVEPIPFFGMMEIEDNISMTANQLADKLEQGHWEGGTREQAATMLRQQANQIQQIKNDYDLDVKILMKRLEREISRNQNKKE